ncbi:MAG: PTS sugar transporter subunit IIA [Spirochaetota bacterium]
MSLSDLIQPDVVKVPLAARSKSEAIAELLDVLVHAGKVSDREHAMNALFERESLGSTGLESGIAVPHAKTGAVTRLTLAIGISPEGIDFQSADGEPSRIFFLMLAPPDQSGPHIEALSEIARLARAPAFLKALARAESAQEVVELINE